MNLGFSRGTALKDPRKLLEGTGKRIRHVKVTSSKDAAAPALRALVVQAAKLAPPKMALVVILRCQAPMK